MKVKSAKRLKKESPIPLLQKWHRNEIFEAIETVGLYPGNFDLSDSGTEVRIKHRSSASYFIERRESGYYVGQRVVGDGSVWPYSPGSWESLMPRVSRLLEEVKRDLETPDLWAEFQREAKLLEAGSNAVTENRPFTPKEQSEIAARLQEIAKYARETYSLSLVQTKALDTKIDYLVDASNRLGRKDWLTVFVGAILGYIFNTALPPESVHGLLVTSFRVMGLLYPEISSD